MAKNNKRLHETLGLPLDPALGLSHVGRLHWSVVAKLHERHNLAEAGLHLRHTDGWEPTKQDAEYHPNGLKGLASKSAISWHPANRPVDLLFLERLIPGISNIERMEMGQMVCDYTGLHDDKHLHTSNEMGILCVLLEAPKGCLVVSNRDNLTEMRKGDVFMLEDSRKHGVFPKRKTKQFDEDAVLDSTKKAIDFGQSQCMKFLLITRRLHGC